ncbi:ArsR/SmtB family transcription factor [Nesterenkonia ebinurensis]|uniref:ArsR/SmtB family transcription factor n=1 Tax=Nesterenkonia ebinurensis TaxID=2608252 RepID=UPI00123CA0C1|nr:metalloregulator ArsR/SmtB family transcription factor [Nesterenkonia ebinurensis]
MSTLTTDSPAVCCGNETEATQCCTAPTSPSVDPEHAADLATRFKALGDPNRIALLSLIAAGENAEACVCDMTEPLGLGQPTVSHHLRILTDAGFLTRQKRGTWAYYSIVPGALKALCTELCADSGLGAILQAGQRTDTDQGACC